MSNPFGYPPRPARGTESGVGFSGSVAELKSGDTAHVLKINLGEIVPNGYHGMATVHIWAQDKTLDPQGTELASNSVLLLDVDWQSGNGGGNFVVDATRGAKFDVGGTSVVNVHARLASATSTAIIPWASLRIEGTVNWNTSATAQSPVVTLPEIVLAAGVASAFVAIPLQAKNHLAQTRQPALLPGLQADFSTSPNAAGISIRYSTLNPNANGTLLVAGVNFVRYVSPAIMSVTPIFELW